ncbi:MAG: hypothetical protein CL792_00455 [Chloroflexi bacterium]|nr:hypothetical protein [Chloroflexota bacterium]|tara:strand:+ start:8250 stop:8990 length:741 start_codon:yes stop_codon:yes gene_type:complete
MIPDKPSALSTQQLWYKKDLLFGFLGMIIGFVLLFSLLVPVSMNITMADWVLDVVTFTLTIFWQLSFIFLVVILAKRRDLNFSQIGFQKPENWKVVVSLIFACYGILIFYGLLIELITLAGVDPGLLKGTNQIVITETDSSIHTILYIAVLAIAVVVVAPIAEEVFFRGLIYRAISGIYSPLIGIIVSGFLFGLFHFNLGVLVPFSLIGMLLAWGFQSTGSLFVPIAVHFVINSVSYVVTVVGGLF